LYNAAIRQNNGRDDYQQYIKVLASPELQFELCKMVNERGKCNTSLNS